MSDPLPATAPTTIYLDCPGQRSRWGVAFTRQSDRVVHLLFVEEACGRRTLARSLEGVDTQDWPPSPVIQQLDRCVLGDDRQALVGVGSSGTSHWSLAVESDADGGLCFDVACRVKTAPVLLRSSYELASPQHDWRFQPQGVICDLGNGQQLSFHCSQTDSQVSRETDPPLVVIQPTTSPTAWPNTIRWKYRLQWMASAAPRRPSVENPTAESPRHRGTGDEPPA